MQYNSQDPLHTFPRRGGGSFQLVASLLVRRLIGVPTTLSWQQVVRCNGIWESNTTQQTQRTFARANLLRTCYGEIVVMDFGFIQTIPYEDVQTVLHHVLMMDSSSHARRCTLRKSKRNLRR